MRRPIPCIITGIDRTTSSTTSFPSVVENSVFPTTRRVSCTKCLSASIRSPSRHRVHGELAHGLHVARDPGPVKGGLHQPAAAQVMVPDRGDQPVADKGTDLFDLHAFSNVPASASTC